MPELTLVTAVTPDYEKLLRWSLPSWRIKKQFRRAKLLVFHHGFKKDALGWIEKAWPDSQLIPWPMPNAANDRERMISAFVLGAAKHVKTDHFIKLDADCYFTEKGDAFEGEDFEVDLCAHKWGYTKPAWWLAKLYAWSKQEKYDPPTARVSLGHKRVISFCCLHKTAFVREAAMMAGDRLPVPSHDTYLWWLAENVNEFTWRRKNLKKLGVGHTHRWKKVRENVCASASVWNPFHYSELLKHVQIEITTACNLACPNCDRNCGTAKTDERMTLEQIKKFVAEALDHNRLTGHRFGRIDIIGGEPTLHPELVPILNEINRYRTEAGSKVRFTSNGTSRRVKKVLVMLAEKFPWLKVRNSAKEKGKPIFDSVNVAPKDAGVKSAEACSIPWRCGIGLSRYGYFLCGAGASVARVFGCDVGVKALADLQLPPLLKEQRDNLCLLCGHSRSCVEQVTEQKTSESWRRAFSSYSLSRPGLEVY